MRNFFVKVSKFLSYILRHNPEKFGIILDSEGFADLYSILGVLNERYKDLEITREFIEELIRHSDKRRFEIVKDKIRAYYGHSFDDKIIMNEANSLPSNLYHGTNLEAYEKIKYVGLKKIGRQYVHLSENIETAISVGKRRTKNPIILVVDTNIAQKEGIKFFKSGDMYLAEYIPPKYISKLKY
ncbi:MAG: RNA 2'-phosphotransferase [Candidatus Hermodarchaeota archaeon]